MSFSSGKSSVILEDILNIVTESEILYYYLGISKIPTVIKSPLRKDNNPSFGLYSNDGIKIRYKDLATKESGGIIDLLSNMWGYSYQDTIDRINNDVVKFKDSTNINTYTPSYSIVSNKQYNKDTDIQCVVRDWEDYDIQYWNSYGITTQWLKYAEVYPISHIIIIKRGNTYRFRADKYAYTYIERKEGKITLKIYQPFNTKGYKWSNKHDSSVISLWTKVPEKGDRICICSSLKDALCLTVNTGIPAIAVQGEGYNISTTAIQNLKDRYENIYILFDNDETGITDGIKLSKNTGFTNIILPQFEGGKDISDLFLQLQDKELFNNTILNLF